MAVKTDNLNLNLNLNLGASAAAGVTGYGRPRFNTEDTCKLMPVNMPPQLRLPTLGYSADWDPDLRAWAYVHEFIAVPQWGGGNTPISVIHAAINAQATFPVPDSGATLPLTAALLSTQVVTVVNAALDRADRAMEIMDQATASGALNYWTGMLRIDPVQEKSAYLLILAARKIGEFVAMGLKDIYRMRRPSQVYPLIMPLIDPPDTPSYPSSHSLQAHLITGVLKEALAGNAPKTEPALDHLANRVALNREIAGVHYRMDSQAGEFAAGQCVAKLRTLPNTSLYKRLLVAAGAELADLP